MDDNLDKNQENKLRIYFDKYITEMSPKPNYIKRVVMAFLIGGLICTIGEGFFKFYFSLGIEENQVRALGAITMIFLGAFLTGIGVYDKIANHAGAGSIVPITGFSNAVSSPAIEFKKEGIVFGSCVKMFTIAGPVIVFGISSSVITGIVYFIYKKIVG